MSTHEQYAFDDYELVELRHRHDDWTPARQLDFLLALSEPACVDEACRVIGMSPAWARNTRLRAVPVRQHLLMASANIVNIPRRELPRLPACIAKRRILRLQT